VPGLRYDCRHNSSVPACRATCARHGDLPGQRVLTGAPLRKEKLVRLLLPRWRAAAQSQAAAPLVSASADVGNAPLSFCLGR
jgi:hypothetical protein